MKMIHTTTEGRSAPWMILQIQRVTRTRKSCIAAKLVTEQLTTTKDDLVD